MLIAELGIGPSTRLIAEHNTWSRCRPWTVQGLHGHNQRRPPLAQGKSRGDDTIMPKQPEAAPTHWQTSEAALRLNAWFRACPHAAIALSGGVDSVLLAAVARHYCGRDRVTAFTGVSASLQQENLDDARAFCATHDIQLVELATNELDDPGYVANAGDRCYHCKRTLFATVHEHLATLPVPDDVWLCTGTNQDDLGDYRPGLRAAAEANVRQPLADCQLTKAAIRELARSMGLRCWAKPASPCLSSRVPHGQTVTTDKLQRIEASERIIRNLGFPIVRVRHVNQAARIEVPADQVSALQTHADSIKNALLDLGFTSVEIDNEGFVSGKLNRSLGLSA